MQVRIDNDGVALAATVEGVGPNVVFVHGLGGSQVAWRPIVARLAERYRCWNLDLRGHGESDRTPGGYGRAGYSSDVVAVLDHIGEPTVGVGHSLGGVSLTRAAAAGHALLAGVYVVDSPLLRRPGGPAPITKIFEQQLAMIRTFQPEGRPIDDYLDVLRDTPYVGGGTIGEAMTPEQLRGRAESLSQLDPECLEERLGRNAESLASAFVEPRVAVPLRVLTADPALGAAFPPSRAPELLELTPRAQVDMLTGVGHQMMMIAGYDELVLADIERWLGQVTAGGATPQD